MSNAMSIDWHRQCLKNQKRSIQEKQDNFDRLQKELQRNWKEYDFYERQILEAELTHKDKFDRERYLINRVKK
jgi:septal ring factor EnvC (AmiA/AmiB activator)